MSFYFNIVLTGLGKTSNITLNLKHTYIILPNRALTTGF